MFTNLTTTKLIDLVIDGLIYLNNKQGRVLDEEIDALNPHMRISQEQSTENIRRHVKAACRELAIRL